ncbi:MAG: hypothetical protein M3O09_09430 [Acidobacteriota bacterium]|nr:hypothetical protein [Acidobacteriota bacterium]
MKCQVINELMPDLALGASEPVAEVKTHLQSCSVCSGRLEEFRKTMALLDEWEAPEPSPYFDVRLRARLREEAAARPSGWLTWLRRPALAISVALLMIVSLTLFHINGTGSGNKSGTIATGPVQPGTAVGDLQALDKNQDLYSNFDVLDDLEVQPDVTANP